MSALVSDMRVINVTGRYSVHGRFLEIENVSYADTGVYLCTTAEPMRYHDKNIYHDETTLEVFGKSTP